MRISGWSSDVCSADLRKYNRTAMIVEPNELSVDPIQLMRQSVADPTQGSVAAKAWINEALAIGQGQTDVDKHHHDAREAEDGGHGNHHAHSHDQSIAPFSLIRRTEEHTSELQSLMRISYAVSCLKKKTKTIT